MMDFNTFMELPKLHKVEYILLAGALMVTVIGYIHQLLNLNGFQLINSEDHLKNYAWFVRAQMICSLMMPVFLIPAIILGVINGAEYLVTALSIYAVIFCIGRLFSRVEVTFKQSRSDYPQLQELIEEMIYQWEKKALPTFSTRISQPEPHPHAPQPVKAQQRVDFS